MSGRVPSRGLRAAQSAVGLAIAIALVGWGLPALTGADWATIWSIVTGVSWGTFAGLLALMIIGLLCYTVTLAASLPGLTHAQALMANLAGSSVSNVLPAGGAVGTALNFAMFRSWGFDARAISTSMVITSVWNLLARLALPVVAAVTLAPASVGVPRPMVEGALAGGAVGGAVAAALIVVIASRRAAAAVGALAALVLAPVLRRLRPGSPDVDPRGLTLELRTQIIGVVRRRWVLLTLGDIGFLGTYFLLFRECAEAVGVHLLWPQVFAAYAVGRLLTAVSVTPGGIGVSEAGAAAVLLALGVPGGPTAACVSLFALFSFVLEIPFGALAALAWAQTRGRYARRAARAAAVGERGLGPR